MIIVNTPGGYAELLKSQREVRQKPGPHWGQTINDPGEADVLVRLLNSGDEVWLPALSCTGAMLVDKDFKPIECPLLKGMHSV